MRGEHGQQSRDYDEAGSADWERRKAEQTARGEAAAADPVLRFYQRHGHPAGHEAQITAPGETDEDDDPGTA